MIDKIKKYKEYLDWCNVQLDSKTKGFAYNREAEIKKPVYEEIIKDLEELKEQDKYKKIWKELYTTNELPSCNQIRKIMQELEQNII